MKFVTHNEKMISVCGTSQIGRIMAGYDVLCQLFGEPKKMLSDPYKIDAEWVIEFEDGAVADIYNYKDGHNYLGDKGDDVEEIIYWHIGGYQAMGKELVERVVNVYEEFVHPH